MWRSLGDDHDPVGARVGGWVSAVVRRRWAVMLAALLLTGLALVGCVRYLGISTDTVDMISPEKPFRQHAKAFNAAFPHLDNTILAVIDAPTAERAEVVAETLAERVTGGAGIDTVTLPGGGFLKAHGLLYLTPEELATLVDSLAEAAPLLSGLKAAPNLEGLAGLLADAAGQAGEAELKGLDRLLAEMAAAARAQAAGAPRRVSWQSLMTGDGIGAADTAENLERTRRFVLIRPNMDFDRLKPARRAIATVRAAAEPLAAAHGAGTTIRLTGEAVIKHEELETVERGGTLAGLLSLVAVSVILLGGLRGPRVVLACLVTLIAGLIWTAGLAAVVIGDLNLISVAFAVLFVGLGIDFCIHFALRYREGQRQAVPAALATAGRGVGGALLLSALCAALGFFSFLPTAYRGLAELGLIAGLGMFVAVGASLTLLPALLAVLGARRPGGEAPGIVARRRDWLLHFRRPVLGGAILLAAGAAALAPELRFDFNPINLRDPESVSIRAFQDLTHDVETTPYAINVLADDLAAATALAARFRADPSFGSVRTLASFVPKHQAEKLALLEDASFFLAPLWVGGTPPPPLAPAARTDAYAALSASLERLAGGDGAVAAAAGRTRAALAALGAEPDLAELETRWTGYLPRTLSFLETAFSVGPVSRADLPEDLTDRWVTPDGRARVEVRPPAPLTDNAELRRFAEEAQAVTPRATGAPVVIHEASLAVAAAFRQALGYAAAAVLLVLALTLRRATDVLLALVPLALAALLTLGTAVLAGISLNFANVIVLPLLMGLGVSSGIHLVLRVRRSGSVAQVLGSSTPRAVLLSVLTTLASFGTLIVSEHRGMSSMGALLTIAVGFTLLAVLAVLPCLLAELEARRAAERGGGRA